MPNEMDPSPAERYQLEKIRRIHIIGASGSGKTTLARALATKLDLFTYHLDEIRSKRIDEAGDLFTLLSADVHSIATSNAWITEGVYLGWTDELLQLADLIIWIDIPWYIVTWQQLVRFVWLCLTQPSSRRVIQKVALLIHFLFRYLMGGMKYYLDRTILFKDGAIQDTNAKNQASTIQCLAPYADKLVHFRRTSEVANFIASLK